MSQGPAKPDEDIEKDVRSVLNNLKTDNGPESQRKLTTLKEYDLSPDDQNFMTDGVFDYHKKFAYGEYDSKLNEIVDTPNYVDQMYLKMKANFKPTELGFRKA